LMFDWPLTIASEILAMTRRFITQYPERCKYDQDALNVVFREAWTPLDPRWNSTHLYSMFGRRLKPYVIHYTSTKPWSRWRLPIWREAAQWYREKLRDSPWADFVEPQAPWDAMRIRADLIDKRYRPILRDKISEYAPFLLDWLGKERSSTRVSWMPRKRSDVELMAQALIAESEGQLRLPSPPEAILDNRSPAPDSSARCQAAK